MHISDIIAVPLTSFYFGEFSELNAYDTPLTSGDIPMVGLKSEECLNGDDRYGHFYEYIGRNSSFLIDNIRSYI